MNHLKIALTLLILSIISMGANSQRQLEKLGRGIVAINQGGGQVYIGWRMLGSDPSDIAFNLYRSTSGGSAVKIAGPLTNTTDFVETGVNTALTNAYFVRPIINGMEGSPSGNYTLAANSATVQYVSIPQKTYPDGSYSTFQAHPGDVNGDGEFEFVCIRKYIGTGTQAKHPYKVDCYTQSGTLLWRADLGPNVYLTNDANCYVLVSDLNGDGKAEVALRTSERTCFNYGTSDSISIGETNGDGRIYYVESDGKVIAAPEFISILNGITGKEISRTLFKPTLCNDSKNPNTYTRWGVNDRPFYLYWAIAYLDGIHPSIITARGIGGSALEVHAWSMVNNVITERWSNLNSNLSTGHNMSILDVDNDGKDEIIFIGGAIDDTGATLYRNDMYHGDHFRICDMDPDYPGYELFGIQQNHPTNLGQELTEAATGKSLKSWYLNNVTDVGRGDAGDYDPRYKGVEFFSTMAGMNTCKGVTIPGSSKPFPFTGLWWNADLTREMMIGVGSTSESPAISRWNYLTNNLDRMYSVYTEGVHQNYGGWPAFCGDILGDWREETVLETSDYSALRIYTTVNPSTTRFYNLMQNPGYRGMTHSRGRTGNAFPDYYLGNDMAPVPPAPMVEAKLHWRGNSTENTWTVNGSSNWLNKETASAFNQNDTVLFDLTGVNTTPITLDGTIAPGRVTVFSPNDYVFGGTGTLSGSMSLTKAGKGSLKLNIPTSYNGKTTVWDGALTVNDSLKHSEVTVYGGVWGGALAKGLTGGRIDGNGHLCNGLSLQYGACITPGNGAGNTDTLFIVNGLTEAKGAVNCFDLTDDPTGKIKKNDHIQVTGNISVTDTSSIVINVLNGTLAPGTYTLFTYSGTLNGNLNQFKVLGLDGIPYTLENPAGTIVLNVKSTREATTVTWAGTGNLWDLANSANWLKNGTADLFVSNDSVLFDDSGIAKNIVNITQTMPVRSITVNASSSYTFNGLGAISGTGGLTKYGTGKLTINTSNSYTGPTIVNGGILEVSGLNVSGLPSAIGASSKATGNFVINGGALSLPVGSSYTDRNLSLGSGGANISVGQSTGNMTLMGVVSGSGKLIKTGSGILMLNAINTYTGGTTIKEGTIQLGTFEANNNGLGSGDITLEGGTLSMLDIQNYNSPNWNVIVPAGFTGGLKMDGRCSMNGKLTGSGTLNLYTPFIRTDLKGNWTGFTGKINVTTDADGGQFRINNSYGYATMAINLAANVNLSPITAGSAVSVGELSGAAKSTISNSVFTIGALNTSSTFAGNIIGNSIIKVGTGTLSLTGNNLYTGGTTVSAGKLLVNTTAGRGAGTGAITVANGAKLGGSGSVFSTVNLQTGSTLEPGSNSIGTLTDSSSLTLTAGSTTAMEVKKSPNSSDLLKVIGKLTFGGTLSVTNIGAVPFAPGDSYKLFDATTYSGKFTTILPSTPGAGLVWDSTELYTTGTLKIATETGISPINEEKVRVYPNPVADMVFIEVGSCSKKARVELFSTNGVKLKQINVVGQKVTIDLNKYPAGMYVIRLQDKGFIVNKSITIVR